MQAASQPDAGLYLMLLVFYTGILAMPITIGIAILRYRLYEIDRLISRTIGWALVTGILVAVFALLVVALQAALTPVTDESTLAVAASTLVAFALFQPLRRRVQRAVDRRFDRARYDGQRTTAVFADRVRNEVDLVTLRRSSWRRSRRGPADGCGSLAPGRSASRSMTGGIGRPPVPLLSTLLGIASVTATVMLVLILDGIFLVTGGERSRTITSWWRCSTPRPSSSP